MNQKKKMRRSIFINKNMEKGNKITSKDLDLKRPGNGISANHFNKIVGKRLIKNINKGTMLNKKHFS